MKGKLPDCQVSPCIIILLMCTLVWTLILLVFTLVYTPIILLVCRLVWTLIAWLCKWAQKNFNSKEPLLSAHVNNTANFKSMLQNFFLLKIVHMLLTFKKSYKRQKQVYIIAAIKVSLNH